MEWCLLTIYTEYNVSITGKNSIYWPFRIPPDYKPLNIWLKTVHDLAFLKNTKFYFKLHFIIRDTLHWYSQIKKALLEETERLRNVVSQIGPTVTLLCKLWALSSVHFVGAKLITYKSLPFKKSWWAVHAAY